MLNAGTLDQRITLQSPTAVRDAAGDEVPTWATVRTVWARVAPIKGRESFSGGANLAEIDTRFIIRAAADLQAGLTPKWRVLHRGRPYNLYSVAESNMGREYIELLAKAGTNEG
jgi:SPP1 family predicted phage head-tail adaptor